VYGRLLLIVILLRMLCLFTCSYEPIKNSMANKIDLST
jgi:hypothetical protein